MNSVQISVVIPAYNEEKYIATCLKSLQKQKFKDFELIVVDNNSTDKTAVIAKSFGAKVVKEKKQGMIPARERGFSVASCDIIARTDADTVLPSNWVRQIHGYFNKYPSMVALTGDFTFPAANKAEKKFLMLISKAFIKHMKIVMGHYPLMGPNYAIRKSVWQKIKVHHDDKIVHEDIDLSCHMAELGEINYFPTLRVSYSLRRWKKKFWKTMYDYSMRNIKTILLHHPKLKNYRHKINPLILKSRH